MWPENPSHPKTCGPPQRRNHRPKIQKQSCIPMPSCSPKPPFDTDAQSGVAFSLTAPAAERRRLLSHPKMQQVSEKPIFGSNPKRWLCVLDNTCSVSGNGPVCVNLLIFALWLESTHGRGIGWNHQIFSAIITKHFNAFHKSHVS